MANDSVQLQIGDIVFAIEFEYDWTPPSSDPRRHFIVSGRTPEVRYTAHLGDVPQLDPGGKLFESRQGGGLWTLYRATDGVTVELRSPAFGEEPYQVALLSGDFSAGDLYTRPVFSDGYLPWPLTYPLDELLMVNLLSRGRGLEVHACGIAVDGNGFLFTGTSGAGKSTTADLWRHQPQVTILSDDRIILRKDGVTFKQYGTPWHGDARLCANQSTPVIAIFFLEKASRNYATPIHPLEAASRLLVRSFPTLYDAAGMAYTLEFLDGLVREVPCFELGFLPDSTAVDFVLSGAYKASAASPGRA